MQLASRYARQYFIYTAADSPACACLPRLEIKTPMHIPDKVRAYDSQRF